MLALCLGVMKTSHAKAAMFVSGVVLVLETILIRQMTPTLAMIALKATQMARSGGIILFRLKKPTHSHSGHTCLVVGNLWTVQDRCEQVD
jgi:hypothetical protein